MPEPGFVPGRKTQDVTPPRAREAMSREQEERLGARLGEVVEILQSRNMVMQPGDLALVREARQLGKTLPTGLYREYKELGGENLASALDEWELNARKQEAGN